jgi:hypothetical protein
MTGSSTAPQHLTQREWKALGDHFVTSTPKPTLLLLLGVVLEGADEAERAAMLGDLPLPATAVWHLVGRPLYARRVRRVRGTSPSHAARIGTAIAALVAVGIIVVDTRYLRHAHRPDLRRAARHRVRRARGHGRRGGAGRAPRLRGAMARRT